MTVTKVEGERMRMDIQRINGQLENTMLLLGETDEMYMIDHDKKSYIPSTASLKLGSFELDTPACAACCWWSFVNDRAATPSA